MWQICYNNPPKLLSVKNAVMYGVTFKVRSYDISSKDKIEFFSNIDSPFNQLLVILELGACRWGNANRVWSPLLWVSGTIRH